MGRLTRTGGLLLLTTMLPCAEAMLLYDPKLCYILDGFLMFYGVIITGMFIREKFFRFRNKPAEEDPTYTDLKPKSTDGGYEFLRRDPERGGPQKDRKTGGDDDHYQSLTPRPQGDEYRALPVKKERRRNKNEQVYQGLSAATKDTYDSLQMQPLVHPR